MNASSSNMPSPLHTEQFKPWLLDILRQGEARVGFNKVNGEFRRMRCTLQEDLIPVLLRPKPLAEGAAPRKVSEESQRVFDLDKQEWRAFRWDKVLSVSFESNDGSVEAVETDANLNI